MRGASREAAAAGREALTSALAVADAASLADELFAVASAVDANPTLRRGLADPSRDAAAKQGIVDRVLAGKVSSAALDVVKALVGQRWSQDRDLTDTVETLAVEAVVAGAERSGEVDRVEDELFRFERAVAGDPELRDVLTNRYGDPAQRAAVVDRLLQHKARPETVRLARQAVLEPRGRKFGRTIEEYLAVAARRREQITAVVTAATPLDQADEDRLARALSGMYGKPVLLQVVVDPSVIGGLRVRVGDEVIDGTVARKLEGARRHLAG